MAKIEFPIMKDTVGQSNYPLRLLETFKKECNFHVNLTLQNLGEIVKFGIDKIGLVSPFHRFAPQEITQLTTLRFGN